MKNFIKNNFAIILAFLLPLLLILFVALSTYLPSLFLKTNYNFVYSVCGNNSNYYGYNCDYGAPKNFYQVQNGKVVENTYDPLVDTDKDGILDINENYKYRLFLHDTKINESREISFEEAKLLNINSLLTSPDGVTVTNGYESSPDFMFFGGGSSYGYYLSKGNRKSKLNIINQERYYYGNFQFVGWVLPGRTE